MKNKQILLTWDAFNNGFVVTAKVLQTLLLEKNIVIDLVYYLQNQSLSNENLSETGFFQRKGNGSQGQSPGSVGAPSR